MTRKNFLVLAAILAVLAGAGYWVKWSENREWKATDARAGQSLLPALKAAEVAGMKIVSPSGTVTLAQAEEGWVVRERADFPADVEKIRELMVKLVELKQVQVEALAENLRARYGLAEPKPGQGSDAAKDAGIVLELSDKAGKSLARLVLGRTLTKRTEPQAPGQPAGEVPTGRYVAGAEAGVVVVVSDPLVNVDAKVESWLSKDVFRVERARTVESFTPDGRQRWAFQRDNENAEWKALGGGDQPDNNKVQDIISSLIYVSLADVTDPSRAGFAKGTRVKVVTFDDIQYDITIGEQAGDDRWHLKFSVKGEPSKSRAAPKGESAEDKEKADTAFEENRKRLAKKLEAEKRLEAWTYLVNKTTVDPLLRERAQFMPERKDTKK